MCCSYQAFFPRPFIRVKVIRPYCSTYTAWKNAYFILSERSGFHKFMSIAEHTFSIHILTLLSVDEILLLRYMNWFTNFWGRVWVKWWVGGTVLRKTYEFCCIWVYREANHLHSITFHRRCPWCNGYRRRKWTRRLEFKSWMRLIAFHIALIPLGKAWIQLFSFPLWVNSRTD